METKLRIENVNKVYKMANKQTFQALYDINVEFKRGELVSIIGESGSGKSTLMNLIGGLDSDFTGHIWADGEDLSTLTDKQLDKYRKNKVGFVFQSFNLISHLSILDNVTLALTLSNVGEKERVRKATEILKKVGLADQIKKNPSQLSGGQKQRVAIARALINDPEIIIADEPTGALDSGTTTQILQILKEIADSGKLVIMVTHSEKVASISSRVVTISDGRIVEDKKNENYKKEKVKEFEQKLEPKEIDGKKKRTGKDKQNLSLFSALRLSIHNMWASKMKNFLMAFGVAIGIGSLILMMTFSSGLTDFIDDTMLSYSNPEIVTISKKGSDEGSNPFSSFGYNPFSEDERNELKDGINEYLRTNNIKSGDEIYQVQDEDMVAGFSMLTLFSDAKVIYSPSGQNLDFPPDKDSPDYDIKELPVFYLYTIPPYYDEKNVLEGEMSKAPELDGTGNITKRGGFMFSSSIKSLVGDEAVGTSVRISFNFAKDQTSKPTLIKEDDEICGIMDVSVMSGFTSRGVIMFVDYDYMKAIVEKYAGEDSFQPTNYYINTHSKAITDAINKYLSTDEVASKKYTGSVEEQLAGLFSSMSSTIGTSLIVISCISLMVSAMMILVVLYMSVSERTKEIGVLKSIGARRTDIKKIFTSESFLVGVLSGICGIIFNLILALILSLILKSTIGLAPISYRWWYFFVAMAVSIVISMLSGLYPASKAARLDPVESLRRE